MVPQGADVRTLRDRCFPGPTAPAPSPLSPGSSRRIMVLRPPGSAKRETLPSAPEAAMGQDRRNQLSISH